MKSFRKFVEDSKNEIYVLKNYNRGLFMKTPNVESSVTNDLNQAYQYSTKAAAETQRKRLLDKDIDTEVVKVKDNGDTLELA